MSAGFQKNYFAARQDLERGNHRAAARKFAKLHGQYGDSAVAARLELELAHALLRSASYADAARHAAQVAQTSSGSSRAMALAVLGSAKHELGRAKMNRGQNGRPELTQAVAALEEMLASHGGLDEGGAMARRLIIAKAELAG